YDFSSSGEFLPIFGADGPMLNAGGAYMVSVSYSTTGSQATTAPVTLPDIALRTTGETETVSTLHGELTLWWDAATDTVKYTYEGQRGRLSDTETISVGVYDSDGDLGSDDFTITLGDVIPDTIIQLDEAGLSFGSGSAGHGPSIASDTVSGQLSSTMTDITWDTSSITSVRADGNLDGTYSQVTWTQNNGVLTGSCEGAVVMVVTPVFVNGVFTGEIAAELTRPLQHSGGLENDWLDIRADYTQTDGTTSLSGSMVVQVKDDAPFGNTPNGIGADHQVTVYEGGQRVESVVIAVDLSGSMDSLVAGSSNPHTGRRMMRWEVELEALLKLAEAYIDNGITANFTVIGFASTAYLSPRLTEISAEDLVALLKPMYDANNFRGMCTLIEGGTFGAVGNGTNFVNPTNQIMSILGNLDSKVSTKYTEKTVYFMTDGEASSPTAWNTWISDRLDDYTVYSVGMGTSIRAGDQQILVNIAGGDRSNFFMVSDLTKLTQTLIETIEPVTGNALLGIGSADVTTLTTVKVNGLDYALSNLDSSTGLRATNDVYLGPGDIVRMVFYSDGTYRLWSQNVPNDITVNIQFTGTDADGDTRVSEMAVLLIMDYKPMAYDKAYALESKVSSVVEGNVMRDSSVAGEYDAIGDTAGIGAILYKGTTHSFTGTSGDTTTINTAWGTLEINRWGGFEATIKNAGAFNNNDTFQYRLVDRDNDWSDWATVVVGTLPVVAQDNIGVDSVQGRTQLLGRFTGTMASESWYSFGGSTDVTSSSDRYFTMPPTHTALTSYQDSRYMHIDSTSRITDANKLQVFGTSNKSQIVTLLQDMGINVTNTGNTGAGLTPYGNDTYGTYVHKTFTASGGQVIFDWSFGGTVNPSASEVDADAAMWFLRDSSGKLVDSGLLSQVSQVGGSHASSGVAVVDIPDTLVNQAYTLYIGVLQLGTEYYSYIDLWVGTVVAYDPSFHFKGNFLTDVGPDGIDSYNASTAVAVTYEGSTQSFGAADSVTFTQANGQLLKVYADGTWDYMTDNQATGQNVVDEFTYTLNSGLGNNTATVYIRGENFTEIGTSGADQMNLQYDTRTDLYINGGDGNDIIYGGTSDNIINGGKGNDTIYTGAGDNVVYGGSGNDTIHTGSGNNQVSGGTGDDTFHLGNGGHDTLVYKLLYIADATGGNGTDTVNGFTLGNFNTNSDADRIDLSELLPNANAGNYTSYVAVTSDGTNTTIR
ncbi:type I secretion C-terminal target domain-containing protein, partial [Desulfosarcina sp. OttesenSCG-928-A07]|nr:type I secretion C-terminal target domain-containing protein [Desulfosarcina sp. OttesenSCG-928-A07]